MAGVPYPSPEQIAEYTAALNGRVGGAQMRPIDTSNLGAPQAPKPRGGFRGLRDWLGITILGADAGRALFPPQQPLQPIAQDVDQFAVGRPWDYPVGYNTRVIPRDSQISFATLKNLAVGYDVLAIMIGRVKDKIVSQRWNIGPKDEKAEGKNDARIGELTDFLEYPDKEHSFDDWTRMLLDQVIMYDAPAIWLKTDRANRLYSLEIIDGSLITPKIGPDGRVPAAEFGPGYQQVLKGLPAVDYVKPVPKGVIPPIIEELGIPFPELLYKPRNPRVDSLYGFGPVEQIITTVNIALRREAYLLSYYTNGSTPDLLLSTPPTWNPNQIAQFQRFWDSVLDGNLDARRGARFIPDGVKVLDTKDRVLTDQTDEWLTRICCFALGLNPMPFVKQMNRGQEKTHHDEAAQEGLEPWLEWFANLINGIIALKFGYPDLVFRWREDEATDENERAVIDQILVNAKIYHPDEIRAKRGDEPMSPDMREQMDMATFSQTANATILSEEQQSAKDEQAVAIAAAKPPPMMPGAGGAPRGAPAAKFAKYSDDQPRDDKGRWEGGSGKPEEMKASEINRELDRLERESSKLNQEFIAAGRGSERPSDTRGKTDPMSVQYHALANRQSALHQEIVNRTGGKYSRMPTRRVGTISSRKMAAGDWDYEYDDGDEAPPVVNHFKFDAPQITIAPPNIHLPQMTFAAPNITVNTPEVKPADVFVDIGATNFSAKLEQPKRDPVERTLIYERDERGKLICKVTEAAPRSVVK